MVTNNDEIVLFLLSQHKSTVKYKQIFYFIGLWFLKVHDGYFVRGK